MQLRRSVRNSISASAGTLPSPDSAAASEATDGELNAHEHYVSVPHRMDSQQSADSGLESNSTDAIAARYADHRVPNRPTTDNHGTSADKVELA